MEIVLVGLNHRTAPVEVRERVSFTAEQARRASEQLRSKGILEETLVLSTCNRSEVYGVPPEASHDSAPGLSTFLSEFHSVRLEVLNGSLRSEERRVGKECRSWGWPDHLKEKVEWMRLRHSSVDS